MGGAGNAGKSRALAVRRHAPVAWHPRLDPYQWRWLLRFLRNCTSERFARNKTRMQRIAHYSKACLKELMADTGIVFDHGTGGVLQVFRTEEELAAAESSARVLAEFGIAHSIVGAQDVMAMEPALRAATVRLAGGLHLPDDETGDCHKFTVALADLLSRRGVRFRFDTNVQRLLFEGDRMTGVITNQGMLDADAYVVALGSEAARALRPLGIDLPIYPVKGYSVTVDIEEGTLAPRSSVMDEHSKIMMTRLGTRLRAAGLAEISGYDASIRPSGAGDRPAHPAGVFSRARRATAAPVQRV